MASNNDTRDKNPGRLFQPTQRSPVDQPTTHPTAAHADDERNTQPLIDERASNDDLEGPDTIPTLHPSDVRDSRLRGGGGSGDTADSGLAMPSTSLLMAREQQRLVFSGTGSEYFRIWIVNIALTIATLGVYSAWAKVRRLQYFYHATSLEGVCFDYAAKPVNILMGRVIALMFFGAYYLAYNFMPELGGVVAMAIIAVLPYLLRQSHRFKARNTLHRSVAFHFDGTVAAAYQTYLPPLLVLSAPGILASMVFSDRGGLWVIALSLLGVLALPLFHAVYRRFMQRNLRYGDAAFGFDATNRDFFGVWSKGIGLSVILGIVFAIALTVLGFVAAFFFGRGTQGATAGVFIGFISILAGYIAYTCMGSYYTARFQKLVWEHTALGDINFKCNLSALKLLKRQVINTLLVIITLGLYRPFAAINVAKLRIESMSVVGTERLDEFFAAPDKTRGGAVGEGAAEFFDMDVSL